MGRMLPGNLVGSMDWAKGDYLSLPGVRFYEVCGYATITTTAQTTIPVYSESGRNKDAVTDNPDAPIIVPATGIIYYMEIITPVELIAGAATGTVKFAHASGPTLTAVATKIAANSSNSISDFPWASAPAAPLGAGSGVALTVIASGTGVKVNATVKEAKIKCRLVYAHKGD